MTSTTDLPRIGCNEMMIPLAGAATMAHPTMLRAVCAARDGLHMVPCEHRLGLSIRVSRAWNRGDARMLANAMDAIANWLMLADGYERQALRVEAKREALRVLLG